MKHRVLLLTANVIVYGAVVALVIWNRIPKIKRQTCVNATTP